MIDRRITKISLIPVFFAVVFAWGCSDDIKKNTVDPDQVKVDNSSNYEFIFKERIKEEKEDEKKSLENNF